MWRGVQQWTPATYSRQLSQARPRSASTSLSLRPLHEGAATARWRSSKTRQTRIQFRHTPHACAAVAAVLRLLEGPAKGGCGRRLLPESMSDRRLIDDLPEGTAGASCSFFVFFGQPCRCPFFLQLCPGGQRQSCGAAAGCSMLLWRPSGEAASAGSAIKPVCIVRTDRCPFRNDYTFDCGATSHVTPSRAAAREVATGRPPPTRTTPLRPLALSFPSPLIS